MPNNLVDLYLNNPNMLSAIIILSIIFTIIFELLKFIFEIVKSAINLRFQNASYSRKEIFKKRLEYTEKIISTLELAYHNINTNQEIRDVTSIMLSISKMNIPRSTYFSKKENKKIDDIIDELKSHSAEYLSMAPIDDRIEELKKCLGIKF